VVEVQFVCCTAHDTFTAISLENDLLHDSWNYTWMFKLIDSLGWQLGVDYLLSRNLEPELKHLPILLLDLPTIEEVEHTVENPNTLLKLLVNENWFRRPPPSFEVLGGFQEGSFWVRVPLGDTAG
jgi:hypothetical protein